MVLSVFSLVVVLVLGKCRKGRNLNNNSLDTHRTWSSSSQREFNQNEKRDLPEIILQCEKNIRTDSSANDKDLEAGLPQFTSPTSLRSDSTGLTPRGGNLNVYGISHPYTAQSANKSVEDFSHLIDHLNHADRLGQGPLLSTLHDDRHPNKGQPHEGKNEKAERAPSMLLPIMPQNTAKTAAQSQMTNGDQSSTPIASHFSWNDTPESTSPHAFGRFGKSVANRLDSWISIPKEKRPPSAADKSEEPSYMADLPTPPAIRKHMTNLSDVSVYSFCDAQTTTLSRGNTVTVQSKPVPSILKVG